MLTDKQVFLLNQLNYCDKSLLSTSMEGSSVGTFVNAMQNAYKSNPDFEMHSDLTETFNQILSDSTLCNMTLENVSFDGLDGLNSANGEAVYGQATSMVFTGDTGNGDIEGVVTFQGSNSAIDWQDNFSVAIGTNQADGVSSRVQESALQYYQSQEVQDILSQCNTITLTGHSKGGNDANYIAIMDSSVGRTVTFDAQGFSDAFVQKYATQIASRQDVFDNHSCSRDYVNILLNSVGNQHYYPTPDVSFVDAHQPGNFLGYQLHANEEVAQDPGVQAVSEMFNCYLRTSDPATAQRAINSVGEMLATSFYGDPTLANLFEGKNAAALGDLLGFVVVYMQQNPNKLDSILGTVKEAHPVVGTVLDFAISHPKMFATLVTAATSAAAVMAGPKLTAFIMGLLAKAGLDFLAENGGSISGLLNFLKQISNGIAYWEGRFANGAIASGEDLRVSSSAASHKPIRWDPVEFQALCGSVRELSHQLSSLGGQLNDVASECSDLSFIVNLSLRLNFFLHGGFSMAGVPSDVIRRIKSSLDGCSTELDTLLKRLNDIAKMMEATEKELVQRIAGEKNGTEARYV